MTFINTVYITAVVMLSITIYLYFIKDRLKK